MTQLMVCSCLNVEIYCKEILDKIPLKDKTNDPFFDSASYASLTIAGVTKVYENLCHFRVSGPWIINHCIVCGIDTHAMKKTTDNLPFEYLVNINLEKNASVLRQSPLYSQVFRIVIPRNDNDDLKNNLNGAMSKSNEHKLEIESMKRMVQQKVNRFINEEQKQMEERIRTFTEQEHSRFAQLQLKVGQEEANLMAIICNSIDTLLSSDQVKDTLKIDQKPEKPTVETEQTNGSQQKTFKLKSPFKFSRTILIDNPRNKNQQQQQPPPRQRLRSRSIAVDAGVFDFDFEDEEINQSDDDFGSSYSGEENDLEDNNDDDDEVRNSGSNQRSNLVNVTSNKQRQEKNTVAYSLPISIVPHTWSDRYKNVDINEDEDDEVCNLDNEELMAERIKQLAKSVRPETNQVFGDLPRRRLNTGDLIKSRPL